MRNPVYSRKVKVNSRSIRLPLITVLFNGILSMVTLLNMYSAMAQVEFTTAIQYNSLMDVYELVATIEFMPLMFIVSTVTVANINGEWEWQTLELMLAAQMTTPQVVIGKPMSALSAPLLLTVSSSPAVTMVSVYGGVTQQDILSLLLYYITVASFAGSLGICFSTPFERSIIPMVVTHGVFITVVAGAYFINKFSLSLSPTNISNPVAAYGSGESAVKPSSGNVIYLLSLDPAAIFYTTINEQMEDNTPTAKMTSYFRVQSTGFMMKSWIIISIMTQLAIAALMIWVTIKAAELVKRRRKQKRAARKGD